jgi:hypothetical protein
MRQYTEPRILITYSQTTPESAEQGDTSDTGFINDEGVSMELDEWDIADELTLAAKTVKYLKSEGACYASSGQFHAGVWYSTENSIVDYSTCTEEERSFHLKGFTEEQEREVWALFHAKRCAILHRPTANDIPPSILP